MSEDINKAENGLNSPETQPFDVFNNLFAGKYVNGTTLVVDGGLWCYGRCWIERIGDSSDGRATVPAVLQYRGYCSRDANGGG